MQLKSFPGVRLKRWLSQGHLQVFKQKIFFLFCAIRNHFKMCCNPILITTKYFKLYLLILCWTQRFFLFALFSCHRVKTFSFPIFSYCPPPNQGILNHWPTHCQLQPQQQSHSAQRLLTSPTLSLPPPLNPNYVLFNTLIVFLFVCVCLFYCHFV